MRHPDHENASRRVSRPGTVLSRGCPRSGRELRHLVAHARPMDPPSPLAGESSNLRRRGCRRSFDEQHREGEDHGQCKVNKKNKPFAGTFSCWSSAPASTLGRLPSLALAVGSPKQKARGHLSWVCSHSRKKFHRSVTRLIPQDIDRGESEAVDTNNRQ